MSMRPIDQTGKETTSSVRRPEEDGVKTSELRAGTEAPLPGQTQEVHRVQTWICRNTQQNWSQAVVPLRFGLSPFWETCRSFMFCEKHFKDKR